MNVAEILQARSKTLSDKTAVIFKGQRITFGQLKKISFCLANSLNKLGISRTDKVAIYLPGCPEYLFSYLALWCCQATAVPLDFMLTEEELASCIAHSDAEVLITRPKPNISLTALKEKCPGLKQVIICAEQPGPWLSFSALIEKGKDQPLDAAFEETDCAVIFYTSGTTGQPKGVMLSYRQLDAPPQAMGFFVPDLNQKDTVLCALPLSHLGGLIYLENCISFGLTVVLMERFIPAEFLKQVQDYKVNCFWIVPSMYYAFLQLKEFEAADLSSLRWVVSFGASNSPEALRRFNQYCPKAQLLNGWGLTETNAPTTVTPMGSKKIESVGRPAPWIKVKVFDDQDREPAAGEIGEIVVRGWVVTAGYYKQPELTKEAMRSGWFHTGDLGKFDRQGDLYIVGRVKEMIKVAGEIVFEPEVEAALHKHPDIAEAAVIGVSDKLRGEVPKAFVVLKAGSSLNEEELRYFSRQHLAHFKVPHHFEFVDNLPKNRTGKVDKEKLRVGQA